eukprot:408867_1
MAMFKLLFGKSSSARSEEIEQKQEEKLNYDMDSRIIRNPYVIIIGISQYEAPRESLPAVISDIKNMKELWKNKFKYNYVSCISDDIHSLYIDSKTLKTYLNDAQATIQTEKNVDGLIIIFSGHGGTNNGTSFIVTSDNLLWSINRIQDKFSSENCDFLANKPKILYVDSCRGNQNITQQQTKTMEKAKGLKNVIHISILSDYFIHYSTCYNYQSWTKSEQYGSYLINAIFKCYTNDYESHLSNLITLNDTSTKINSIINQSKKGTQTSEIVNRLVYDVYIQPFTSNITYNNKIFSRNDLYHQNQSLICDNKSLKDELKIQQHKLQHNQSVLNDTLKQKDELSVQLIQTQRKTQQQQQLITELKQSSKSTPFSIRTMCFCAEFILFLIGLCLTFGIFPASTIKSTSTEITENILSINTNIQTFNMSIINVGFWLLRLMLHVIFFLVAIVIAKPPNGSRIHLVPKLFIIVVFISILPLLQISIRWCNACAMRMEYIVMFVTIIASICILQSLRKITPHIFFEIMEASIGLYVCVWLMICNDLIPIFLVNLFGEHILINFGINQTQGLHHYPRVPMSVQKLMICKLILIVWMYIHSSWVTVLYEIFHCPLTLVLFHFFNRIDIANKKVFIVIHYIVWIWIYITFPPVNIATKNLAPNTEQCVTEDYIFFTDSAGVMAALCIVRLVLHIVVMCQIAAFCESSAFFSIVCIPLLLIAIKCCNGYEMELEYIDLCAVILWITLTVAFTKYSSELYAFVWWVTYSDWMPISIYVLVLVTVTILVYVFNSEFELLRFQDSIVLCFCCVGNIIGLYKH